MGINPSCWRKEDGNKSVNESFEISWRMIETKTRLETPRMSGYKGNIVQALLLIKTNMSQNW